MLRKAIQEMYCIRSISVQGNEMCLYGDKDKSFCTTGTVDCSIKVARELCCGTCADFVIPSLVEGVYLCVNICGCLFIDYIE